MATIDVAVVGSRFGAHFLPLYRSHPQVGSVALVDVDTAALHRVADEFGVNDRFTSLDELLATDRYDAVHVASPVRFHVEHSVAVLRSGRHCASAVPMATTLDGIEQVLDAERDSGRVYMMMETMVFGRAFFYVKDLIDTGRLGPLTLMRGDHIQNLDGYPSYWRGFPPLNYATHIVSPLLALADARVEKVAARGSGILTEERRGDFSNPFPAETGLFALDRDGLTAEVTVSFFQTARSYYEGFSVFGHDMGVEWPMLDEEDGLTVYTLEPVQANWSRPARAQTVHPPDRTQVLPAELRRFTRPSEYDPGDGRPVVRVGAAHGGSHPHLAHEFVSAAVADRPALVDGVTAATWTAPGICGHASAMADGAWTSVPGFGTPHRLLDSPPGAAAR